MGFGFDEGDAFLADGGGRFLFCACVFFYALAEGVHEVDDLAGCGGWFFFGDRDVVDFGFDHGAEGGLVLVFEFFGGELCGFALDEFFGERELVGFDGDFFDFVEVFGWFAELFLVAHDVGHHAGELVVVVGHDGDEVLAATEGDFAERDFFGGLEGFADDGEGFGLGVAFGGDEVGFFEEGGGDVVVVDELGDFEGVAWRGCGGSRSLRARW